MKIEPFELERWLIQKREIDLAGAGVVKLRLRELGANLGDEQTLGYDTTTNGAPALREAIAGWYPGAGPENVLVTNATSEANMLVNLHLLEPGDEYAAVDPMYQQTTGFARCLGAKVVKVLLDEKRGWAMDLAALEAAVTPKTRIVFLDNPNNPTGACLDEAGMRAVCDIAARVGAWVVCDNALRGSELCGEPATVPYPMYERGIVTGSISKLGMTGPRLGWIIASPGVVAACWRFKDYTTLSHSGLSEYLGTIALEPERREAVIARNLAYSRRNIETLAQWAEVHAEHVRWTPPEAGFATFVKYHAPLGSREFCTALVAREGVLVSPGAHFGLEGYFRMNIGAEETVFTEGLKRMGRFLETADLEA